MKNLFLTASDQILDLECVAAIEIADDPLKHSNVLYHLPNGVTVVSPQSDHEAAVEEKWRAYQQMKPLNHRMHGSGGGQRILKSTFTPAAP